MFKEIPYTPRYKISLEGKVYDENNKEIKVFTKQNEEVINIPFNGKKEILSIPWLINISYFEINFEIDIIRKVEFCKTKPWKYGNYLNVEPFFRDIYPVYKSRYNYEKTYKLIARYPTVGVSKYGDILDIKTGNVSFHSNEREHTKYPGVEIYDSLINKYKKVSRHVLVALAWVRNNDRANLQLVNHKDGNKCNPYYKNLEWTDYSGNLNHAYKAGLKDSTETTIRNIKTKTVYIYYSLSEAARAIGTAPSTLKFHLVVNPHKVVFEKWEVRLSGDKTPWLFDSIPDVQSSNHNKFTLTKGKDIKVFYGIKSLIKFLKLPNDTRENYKLFNDTLDKLDYTLKKEQANKVNIIESLNRVTNEVLEHKSVRSASRELHLGRGVIRYTLKKGADIITDNYSLRYKTDEEWPIGKTSKNKARAIIATNSNGDIIECSSMRDAQKRTRIDAKYVAYNLKGKPIRGNWEFSYK